MEDKEAERIIEIFKSEGMQIELGAQYSVRGQIAQLLNGCKKLFREQKDSMDKKYKCGRCGTLHDSWEDELLCCTY